VPPRPQHNVLIKYERSSLWMQEGEQLKPLAQYGYGDIYALQAEKLTVYGDIYEHLKTERQSLMIADVTAEPQWQQRPWLSGDRAWMGVPIRRVATSSVCSVSPIVSLGDSMLRMPRGSSHLRRSLALLWKMPIFTRKLSV
jgi:hypothetical protein